MLRNTETQIKLLDGIISSLNLYLLKNKKKVNNNESNRSNDIETLVEHVYNCFDINMTDAIDDILSEANLSLPNPTTFPLPSSLKKPFLSPQFSLSLNEIKSHPYRKGLWGQSELKAGIDSVLQEQILFYAIQHADKDLLKTTRGVSTFFDKNTPRESYILFHAKQPADTNIYFVYPQLLNRLSACFKSARFLDGNTAVQVKRDNYDVLASEKRESLFGHIPESSLCFMLKMSLFLSDIKQMQEDKQLADILGNVSELEVFEYKSNTLNPLGTFKVSYDTGTNKLSASDIPKQAVSKVGI